MQLLKGLLLVVAFTPLCWVSVLVVVRKMRETGLVGPGLDELFNQGERYAWIGGVFLALLLVSALGRPGGAFLKGLVLVLALTPACWAGVVVGIKWAQRQGVARSYLDGHQGRLAVYSWIAGALLALVIVGLLVLLRVPFLVGPGQ
jgi:hypothetical protein